MKLHVAGLLAAATSILGILSAPNLAHVLPPQVAAAIAIVGVILQAVTKPVPAGGMDLVPKPAPLAPAPPPAPPSA